MSTVRVILDIASPGVSNNMLVGNLNTFREVMRKMMGEDAVPGTQEERSEYLDCGGEIWGDSGRSEVARGEGVDPS